MSFPFNLPIALTLFRIVLVPLIIVFVISSDRVRVLIAAVIFVAASLTDWLDGFMARRRNQVTRFGTLLDPVADKLLVAAALVALVQVDMVRAWVAMVIIGRELAVTGLRGVALSMGVVVPASSFGKLKTVSQYVGITILILERGVPPRGAGARGDRAAGRRPDGRGQPRGPRTGACQLRSCCPVWDGTCKWAAWRSG